MAPNAPMTRPRIRREPAPLDQIPAWGELAPLDRPAEAEAPVGLDALLGGLNPDQFRAVTLSAGDEIGFALTRGLSDDEWAEDTFFGSRRPFQSLTAMQRAFPHHCAAKGVYSVRMTSTAQCERRPGANTAARNSATPPKPNN